MERDMNIRDKAAIKTFTLYIIIPAIPINSALDQLAVLNYIIFVTYMKIPVPINVKYDEY